MPTAFHLIRKLAIASVPDPDPNVTPPADDAILGLSDQPLNGRGGAIVNAIAFYFEANNGAAGTVSYKVWVRDRQTNRWVGPYDTQAAVAARSPHACVVELAAEVFVQITAVAGFVAATDVFTRATEQIL